MGVWNTELTGYGGQPTKDRVINGNFDTDTIWGKKNGSTILGGVATIIGNGSLSSSLNNWSLFQSSLFTGLNKKFRCVFYARQTVGSGNFMVGSGYSVHFSQAITSSFTRYEFVATTTLLITEVASLTLSIGGMTKGDEFELDSIIVQELQPDLLMDFNSTNGVLSLKGSGVE
jgi:hypothetical protein